jgi:hypothetical protein
MKMRKKNGKKEIDNEGERNKGRLKRQRGKGG